jgi:hypothetical protein
MKKIFKFAAIVAATAALFSCQEKPTPEPTPDPEKPDQEQPGQTELNENIKFTIEFTEATENSAKFRVEHDGARTDTWHYFATTQSDIAAAIETEAAALAAEGKAPQASTGKNVTVRGLEAETEYTLVVFGVTKTGEVYGEPATLAFETTAAPIEGFQVNPAWKVSYIGDYEYEGEILQHVVAVESTDNNPYFTTAWPKDQFEQTPIETIAEAEISAWVEYLTQYGKTLEEILSNESSLSQVDINTKYGNEWYVIAIGADAKGNATGYYAVSDLVTIVEEEPTEEYAAWLGNWTFTGANGVAFDVTMSKGTANKTYLLSGWEGPESEGLDITVEWMAEDGIWAIFAQLFGTFNFGSYGDGPVYLVPQDADGYIYPKEGIPACIGGFTEDGQRMVVGYSEETEDGLVEMVTMMYLANLQNQWYTITSVQEWPTFPLTVTETATTTSERSAAEFKVSKKSIKSLRDFNVYNSTSFMVR